MVGGARFEVRGEQRVGKKMCVNLRDLRKIIGERWSGFGGRWP